MYNEAVKKTAQQIQDEIFRKMSADQKIKLGSELWRFAKEVSGGRIFYSYDEIPKSILRKIKKFEEQKTLELLLSI